MEYLDKVKVSASPHVKSNTSVSSIMLDVIIALIPTALVGIYFFGLYALMIILVCIISCVVFEFLMQKILKRDVTISDMSAVLTGLLLALNLPPSVPLWIPVVGAFFAIVIVKQLFGGIGQNFMNPALGGRAFLVASWPGMMIAFVNPYSTFNTAFKAPDVLSSATPMAILRAGEQGLDVMDMLIGNIGGCIGEVSAAALILGGIYLLIKKVITWHIPVSYIATVVVMVAIFGIDNFGGMAIIYHIAGGGLLIGSIFMATDYSSSPVTNKGRLIFGVGCGLLTAVFRLFGASAEGVSYAILIMNLVVPLIDKACKPKLFGEVKA